MKYPITFEELVLCFKKFAGVGSKSAERMAYQVLDFSADEIQHFIETLHASKTAIKRCQICGHLSEDTTCLICQDDDRDDSLLCVVQSPRDVFALEKANEFHGKYHVLHGVISAVNGVGPNDINLSALVDRVRQGTIKEVIVATNPNIEGETTALYLAKMLEGYPVNVTRLAYGLPVGGNLDYADAFTLMKAFEGRRKI